MSSVRDLHPLKREPNFRWRGGNPSHVEALTYMVFAFVLTLLVVSNAPPGSFDELVTQLWMHARVWCLCRWAILQCLPCLRRSLRTRCGGVMNWNWTCRK